MFATDPYLAIVGGRGCAKTRFAAIKAHQWLESYPGLPFAVTADDYPKFRTNFYEEFSRFLGEIGWQHGREYEYNHSTHQWRCYNGATLTAFTFDKRDEKLKGPTLAGVIMDETDQYTESAYQIFEICVRDPRGPRQRIILANATPPTHWINQRFEMNKLPFHRLRRVTSYENIFLPEAEIRKLEAAYPPGSLQHRRWVLGEPVAMEGSLWPEFSAENNVVSPEKVPQAAVNVGGLDVGFRDPFAFVNARVDGSDVIFINSEYEQNELSALAHKEVMAAIYEGGIIYSDPEDPSTNATLRDLGFNIAQADNDLAFGIEKVRQYICRGQLKVSSACQKTITAIMNSTWNKNSEKEKPNHDKYSHLASAVRYLVMGVDGGRRHLDAAFVNKYVDSGSSY